MEILEALADWGWDMCQILTCAALLIRPIRERLLGTEAMREGQRCLLRSEILGLYYRNHGQKQLREFEYRNLEHCYKAYKALKGNSFIEHIHAEMQEWEII